MIRFLVIHQTNGNFATALDACQICGRAGYRQEGQNIICRNCGASIYAPSIGEHGGCNPIPVKSTVAGGEVIVDLSALADANAMIHSLDMFIRIVGESFLRNPRRKALTAAALVVGMAVATATLTIALEVGDRLAREFRSLGANLVVRPQSDTLPLEIGGVDYRPVDAGAYLNEADLGKLKMIFWRHNILGFTPFLDVPALVRSASRQPPFRQR